MCNVWHIGEDIELLNINKAGWRRGVVRCCVSQGLSAMILGVSVRVMTMCAGGGYRPRAVHWPQKYAMKTRASDHAVMRASPMFEGRWAQAATA